jgi:hypothetical protein
LTDDYRDEEAASLIQLAPWHLLLTYDLWPRHNWSDSSWKMLRRSTDGGQSWSDPESLVGGSGIKYWPRIGQSANGTVWIFYRNQTRTSPVVYNISYICSTDNGYNWSTEQNLPTDTGPKRGGVLFQPAPNKLWVFYSQRRSATGYDIYHQTSTDNGNTWLGGTPVIADPGNQFFGSIVWGPDRRLWLFYSQSAQDTGVYYRTSGDTGRTWSAPESLLAFPSAPYAVVDQTGKFWLALGATYGLYNSEVYYVTSVDTGRTWSDTSRLTSFAGYDWPTWFTLVDGQPLLLFDSERRDNSDVYCGHPDSLSDPNPPPCVPDWDTLSPSFWNPHTNPERPNWRQSFAFVALCQDEESIASARLVYSVNGVPQPDLPLYDDGGHGDYAARDDRWGRYIGPFPQGPNARVACQVRATDVDGNSILAHRESLIVTFMAIHDTGNLQLYISPYDGRDGDPSSSQPQSRFPSCRWPRDSMQDYLYEGNIWVGVVQGNETLVSCLNLESGVSDWATCAGDSLRWDSDTSDLSSHINIDDRNAAPRPIGIRVQKHSMSWHHWRYDDFIIQEYIVSNTGVNGSLTGVFAAFAYDFDAVNSEGGDDRVGFDGLRWLSYLYDNDLDPAGHIGLRMLSQAPRNHCWWKYAGSGDTTSDGGKFRLMATDTVMLPPAESADYRVMQTAGPFNLAVGQSETLVVGLVAGDGLAGIRANADAMEELYDNHYVIGVEEPESGRGDCLLTLEPGRPSVARRRVEIRYVVATEGNVDLMVLDPSGRLVRTLVSRSQRPGAYSVTWDGDEESGRLLNGGVYFVRLESAGAGVSRKLVLTD